MITPIPIKGFGTLEQRAYLLLSLAVGCFGISRERQDKAIEVWQRFVTAHPKFTSPLVSSTEVARAIGERERERSASIAEHLNGWGAQPNPELANHIAKVIRAG